MVVIPVLNCADRDLAAVRARVDAAKTFSDWVHLDVSDGTFTFNKSWRDAALWRAMGEGLKLEVHLMVEHPEAILDDWLQAGAKRVIFHVETVNRRPPESNVHALLERCRAAGAEVMLAAAPETPVEALARYAGVLSHFQILAVHAGPAGQKLLRGAVQNVRALRRALPHATIEVDGGVVPETIPVLRKAGADIVVSGSYIFNAPNPKAKYDELARA